MHENEATPHEAKNEAENEVEADAASRTGLNIPDCFCFSLKLGFWGWISWASVDVDCHCPHYSFAVHWSVCDLSTLPWASDLFRLPWVPVMGKSKSWFDLNWDLNTVGDLIWALKIWFETLWFDSWFDAKNSRFDLNFVQIANRLLIFQQNNGYASKLLELPPSVYVSVKLTWTVTVFELDLGYSTCKPMSVFVKSCPPGLILLHFAIVLCRS